MKNLIIMINVVALLAINHLESMGEYQKSNRRPSRPVRSFSAMERMSKERSSDILVKAYSDSWGQARVHPSSNTSKKEKKMNDMLRIAMEKDITKEKDLNGLLAWVIVLLHNGADPNMVFMGESLLHKALILKVEPLIKALLEHNADHRDEHFLIGPIFFDAPTTEIAQLFIDKGIDVNKTNGNSHNVLWHIIDFRFPSELISFYLKHNVNVNHINEFDGSCVLHSFAAYKEVKDEDNFLTKARLIVAKNPALVNTVDHNNKTPCLIAEETIAFWSEKYPACVNPLQKLINLFKGVV